MLSLRAEDVSFSYGNGDVLSSVSFSVEGPGTLAVLGSNGSGKSTLARLIDGLLPLRRGSITVCGIPVMDRSRIHELRKHIGIIFQDPDSQFVSPVLEEDTAFGPENFGFSGEEVSLRVDSALCETGLSAFRKRSPQSLSGGEKERAQLAGIIAYGPDIIMLDESFTMLDRRGKEEMKALVRNFSSGKLIIFITHSADEASAADNVLLLSGGRVLSYGPAHAILQDADLLRTAGVRPPFAVCVREELARRGIDIAPAVTEAELLEALWNFA